MASRVTDKLIKAASKMVDMPSVDPPIKDVLPNLTNYAQLVEETGKAYVIMIEVSNDIEKACQRLNKMCIPFSKDVETIRKFEKLYAKNLTTLKKAATTSNFLKEYNELCDGFEEAEVAIDKVLDLFDEMYEKMQGMGSFFR